MTRSKYHMYVLFLAILMGFGSTLSQAATYKWVDKDGNVNYSQRPPPDTNYERLNIKTPPPESGSTTPATPAPAATGSDNSSSDTVAQEMAKNAEIRAKNCAAAKSNLELYTVYKRVRKEDGSVVRLDDNERARKIEESKAAIKEFCD